MEDQQFNPNNSEISDYFFGAGTSSKSEFEESVLSLEKDLFNLPEKRKKVRQPKDPNGKFYKTLPGFLINYLETQGPTSEKDILRLLDENLSNLRNASGTSYKNSSSKCLQGICRMPIFCISNTVWDLNSEEVSKYRESFIIRTKKKQKLPERNPKGLRKTDRIVNLLRNFSGKLAKDPRTERLVMNPLKELIGNEDLQEAETKLGQERLMGILQAYSVVSRHFIKIMKREENSIQYSNIEKDIEGIHSKLARIEGRLLKYTGSSANSESNK
ncbi:hypothetical protein SteCoe_5908 [Stentor coeruleus]|uniref:Uncharacterized protein n=1 Tax=Stentor coeruleus TaxID=5963 RepID=A0A1R2CRC1_9CILI|nr:hypothetical protein SteCoe_5908 [Stentor coeruleus]